MQKTLVVAGGGAAGFFCAVTAARLNPKLKVILVEKTGKLLSKVKVSGGGRCNVTHACFSIPDMIKKYPRGSNFVKKTFHQFFTTDTIQWFEERGVPLKTEADGRIFPVSNSSQSVIDCLLQEANKYSVEIRLHHEIRSIEYKNDPVSFIIHFNNELKSARQTLSVLLPAAIPSHLCLTGSFPADTVLKRRFLLFLPLICPVIRLYL